MYDGKSVDIVDSFKYLGVIFNFNGKFDLCQKNLREQGCKAMFALLSRCNTLNLPIDLQLDLFDKMVVPILTYGGEIWGFSNNSALESVNIKFYKYVLGVKKTTPNCMVYGELGKFPIDITIKCKMITFWNKLVNGKQSKLSYKMYKIMYELYQEDKFKCDWLSTIHKTLNECGMTDIWLDQSVNINDKFLKRQIHLSLKDQFVQSWHSELDNSSKCILYKSYKLDFEFEKYLILLNKQSRKLMIKFRTSNHKLPVERGRYANVDRNNRYCDICDRQILGDEFHLLLECSHPTLVAYRNMYLKNCSINMFTFVNIMSRISSDITLAHNVTDFLRCANSKLSCIR
jgi:hypothetical protein